MDVETGFLCEALQADVALIGPLAGVRARVYLQVLLAGEGGGARQALERSALDRMYFFVQIERALLREGLEADGALERPLPGVYTFMSAKAGLLSEPLVTDVALIGAHFVDQRLDVLLCVNTFVRVETGFLRESFEAEITLEGALSCMCAHMHF